MSIRHFIVCASLLCCMHHRSEAEVTITGKVLDQNGEPVPNIRVLDVSNRSFSTNTDASGGYSLSLASTNRLQGVILVAHADYISHTSIYSSDYPAISLNTNQADIVVVRKPETAGNVSLVIPWLLEHGPERGISYSNLVVQIQDSYGLQDKKLYNYSSLNGLCITNIVFGREYIVKVDVAPLARPVISSVRGVFYDRAVGSTNEFKLLNGSSAQVGVTNLSYIIKSKKQANETP